MGRRDTVSTDDDEALIDAPGRLTMLWLQLKRPLLWTLAAFTALGVTVAVAISPLGQKRLAAFPGAVAHLIGARDDRRPVSPAQDDLNRLRDETRRLAAERARLELRVVQLERNYEDVTGSIGRLRNGGTAAPPAASDDITGSIANRQDAAPATVRQRVEASPGAPAGSLTLATRSQFALDLGTEPTLAGLRARWQRLAERHGSVVSRMDPLVAVRDGPNGLPVLHLLAGPLADVAEVAAACAALRGAGVVACQPAPFEGQRLSPH